MRNYLGVGFVLCAACAQVVDDPASGELTSNAIMGSALTTDADGARTVTLELGQSHVLEFAEGPGEAWVFERRLADTPSALGAGASAPNLYRDFREANPSLPALFSDSQVEVSQPAATEIGVSVSALSKEEFLSGDGICARHCETEEFAEGHIYTDPSTEVCLTDIPGRDFRPNGDKWPAAGTSAYGDKLFFAVNTRTVGGTFKVNAYLEEKTYVDGELVDYRTSDVRTKTEVLQAGEAFAATLTIVGEQSQEIQRAGVAWAELTGDDDAIYDYYTCAASRSL
jgi:hypothetical protein